MGRLSGVLEVTHADATRRLHFLAGDPIAFHSTAAEDDMASLLVEAGDVEPETAREWTIAEPSVSMLDARIASGELDPDAARATWQAWIARGVVAPLDRVDGTWVFWHHDRLRPGSVDPDLLPGVSTLDSLCRNPAAVVAGRVALAEAEDRESPLRRGPRHADLSAGLELPERLRVAIETEGELAAMVLGGDAAALDVARLVWILVRLGVIAPDEGIEVKDLLDELRAAGNADPAGPVPPPAASRDAEPPPLDPDARPPRGDPDSRDAAPVDPVRFLGLAGVQGREGIGGAIERLGQRWREAAADPDADPSQRAAAELLLQQVRKAAQHLEVHGTGSVVTPDEEAR